MKTLATIVAGCLALGLAAAGCGNSEDDDESPSASAGGSGGNSGAQGSSGKGGGDKGGSSGSSGSSSSNGDAGSAGEAACTGASCAECKLEGEACEPGDCCDGACIESETGELSGCRPLCQDADECDSGCCQPFSNAGGGFCVDAAYCSCVEQDGACGPGVESACCDGSTCAITDGPYACQQICTAPDECPEECCLALPGTDFDICAPAEYCL